MWGVIDKISIDSQCGKVIGIISIDSQCGFVINIISIDSQCDLLIKSNLNNNLHTTFLAPIPYFSPPHLFSFCLPHGMVWLNLAKFAQRLSLDINHCPSKGYYKFR